jgi:mxaL protein
VIAALPLARNMRSPRFLALALALVITGAALVVPVLPFTRTGAEILAIVDITGSMNVRDYARVGRPESRLDRAKAALRRLVADLPCGSRLALGLFTERQPFLLFEPIETCGDFAPLDGALASLDWRMAWEGDSRIAAGLYRAIDMAAGLGTDLVFITDGQEAPPLPGGGPPMFEGRPGAVRGLIVGAGGYALSPIPRYDDRGREKGFYGEADVQQESRFGPPPADAETREGYNPRNAPFGSAAAQGTEHLSSVREPYLKRLAAATGLAYAHLDGPGDLQAPLRAAVTPRALLGALNPRPFLGALALVLVLATLSAGQAAALRRRLPPFLSHTENT